MTEDDVHYSHRGLNTNNHETWSVTKEHDCLRRLEAFVKSDQSFYIHGLNDQKSAPELLNTSQKYPQRMKKVFENSIKTDPEKELFGWWVGQMWKTNSRQEMIYSLLVDQLLIQNSMWIMLLCITRYVPS